MLIAAIVATALHTSRASPLTAMQVVVSPHPDDELEGWAKIRTDDDLYTVFVVMTNGEGTANCNGAPGLDRRQGERPPRPTPGEKDQKSQTCARARIDSWQHFLDLTAKTLPHGDQLADMRQVIGADPSIWVGPHSARVVFDLGDGNLTGQEVKRAVRQVIAQRGNVLPGLPVRRLVAAAYWNDAPLAGDRRAPCPADEPCPGDDRDYEYENRDHEAVSTTLAGMASLTEDGVWIATGEHDPAATEDVSLPQAVYAEMMGLGPGSSDDVLRKGAQQVAYGWLSFPGRYWIVGERSTSDSDVLFPRVQSFRHVS